jgi:hypothetical protein
MGRETGSGNEEAANKTYDRSLFIEDFIRFIEDIG